MWVFQVSIYDADPQVFLSSFLPMTKLPSALQTWTSCQPSFTRSFALTGCGKRGWFGRPGRDSIGCGSSWTGLAMRGPDQRTEGLFSYVSCESRVPAGHPLRAILPIADAALAALSGEFQQLYALNGRPSIAPEKLLRALLLQAFYSVRSERQLMEQLDYNLLFRWFVGLGVDDPVWDVTVFTKNRRPAARGRDRREVPAGGAGAAQGQDALVGRALLGRRHVDPGLGFDEELSAEGRQRRAAGTRTQR